MAYLRLKDGYTVAAVEGKVDAPFGDLVAEWNDGSSGRVRRLAGLCDVLRLDPSTVAQLRYQLLHRAVSAIFEAERYQCNRALLLVHSFSGSDSGFADFTAFANAIHTPISTPGTVSAPSKMAGVELRCTWIKDEPLP
jgi:hypothetical protein